MLSKLTPWTIGLSLLAATLIPEVLLYYIRRFRSSMKPQFDYLNEVMFFTDKGVECKYDCYKKKICYKKESCSYQHLRRLVNLLESSTRTLDICIYLMTCQDLAEAIVRVKRKGVMVRVIADGDMSDKSGCQITRLRSEGVFVRTKKSPYLMHHKFAVIDDNILINGSCNWTMQGLTGNWDNIIVTSVPQIVQPFSKQFSQLWEEFSENSN